MKKITFIAILILLNSQLVSSQCWQKVSAGDGHTLAIKDDGTLWAWGGNILGGVGDGTNINRDYPVMIGTDNDWVEISAGNLSSFAIKEDGSLWAWGYNAHGILGNGNQANQFYPIRIGFDNDWSKVSFYGPGTMALKTNGTLWAWGIDANFFASNIPVQINGTENWKSIIAGINHRGALTVDGALWMWGENDWGQIGNGTTEDQATLTKIDSTSVWKQIALGFDNSWGIKEDGTLWTWGINSVGAPADPTLWTLTTPTQITTDNDWAYVIAGDANVIALKDDGTLWAWGTNQFGQLGIGDTSQYITIPTEIGNDDDWILPIGTRLHNFAFKNDGTLWAWGWNSIGQLGNANSQNQYSPVKINCIISEINPQPISGFEIHLFPNPSTELVKIRCTTPITSNILWIMYDQLGREMRKTVLPAGKQVIQVGVEAIPSGLYVWRAFVDGQMLDYGKLIISK